MDQLDTFASEFTDKKFDHILVGDIYYTPKELPAKGDIIYMSTRLGKQKRNSFEPSLAFLDLIAPHTKKVAVLNAHAAWLFICEKNVLKEGIISCEPKKGHVLVLNENKDVLGYGKITGAGITNKLDRGDFLRRER